MYFDVPGSGVGSEGTNYDATEYLYDDMGRRVGVRDATETITRSVYDAIGRMSASYIGTNDNDSGTFGVTFESTGTSDMVKTSDTVYDAGADGGNSLVTKTTAYVENSATGKRETTYDYDERGRRILTTNQQAPHVFVELDNLGRTTYVGQFTSVASIDVDPTGGVDIPSTETTNRTALSLSNYDELGRVWKSQRYKIIQSTGATGVTIDSESWWDSDGRPVKQQGNMLTKTAYDRIGRATHQYVLAYSNDSAYADADDVTATSSSSRRRRFTTTRTRS
jgi:YD repeat-containing protein